jgi:hypothetical protein
MNIPTLSFRDGGRDAKRRSRLTQGLMWLQTCTRRMCRLVGLAGSSSPLLACGHETWCHTSSTPRVLCPSTGIGVRGRD